MSQQSSGYVDSCITFLFQINSAFSLSKIIKMEQLFDEVGLTEKMQRATFFPHSVG